MGVRPPKKLATMVLYLALESIIFSARKTIIKNFVDRAENSPENTDSTLTYVKEQGRNKKSDFHLV